MAYKFHQGKFKPRFPKKYKGDVNNIIFRSGLELKFFRHFDTRKNILEWSSEEVIVPYYIPGDDRGKFHRYFVDAWVKVKKKDDSISEFLIEIKPFEQTKPPKQPSRKTSAYKRKVSDYLLNQCKWQAATKFADKNKIKFIILTELDI